MLVARRGKSGRARKGGLKQEYAQEQAERGHLQQRRKAQKPPARQLRRQPLQRQDGAEHECARREHDDPVGRQRPNQAQETGIRRGEIKRPDKAAQCVQRRHGEAQRRRQRGYFGQENRARAKRQRGQHEHVAPIRKSGIPAQHDEDPHRQHGEGDEHVFRLPDSRRSGYCAEHQTAKRKIEADKKQQPGELSQQLRNVAMGRQQFQIHHAEEELAIENAEGKVWLLHVRTSGPDQVRNLTGDGRGILLHGKL